MSVTQLITSTFDKAFRKYFYDELVVGKLAHTNFKSNLIKGDEIDVVMPGTVSLFDYDGSTLSSPEDATASIAKIKISNGKAFHFQLTEPEQKQIELAPSGQAQVDLAKEYSNDAIKQFAASVDKAFAGLYTRAGYYLDNSGSAISLTSTVARDILAYMQATFQRGDGKGHTSWIDGQMVAVVPPEYQFYLGKLDEFKYVESGHEKLAKGYIGRLCGWDILVSNNIAQPETGVYYPLFGIKGKTLAGGISADLNTQSYVPNNSFNTCYKGFGLYGVGAPRADFLGTAKISATISLS
ncbi:hypothetical protein IJI31_04120 [bacterium]|nr:hypothetical protein [bacterium]